MVSFPTYQSRGLIFLKNYIMTYFHSEMVLIYGATLDTRILLFFQAIYMLPMFCLGVLLFYGVERVRTTFGRLYNIFACMHVNFTIQRDFL